MIRKGLKPGFGLGLDRPGGDDYRRVLPFRRSWVFILILLVFDAVFLFPAITTFQQVVAEWRSYDDLFDLTGALFMTAWLLGWSMAPLLLTTLLAIFLFGREVVKARPGEVDVFIGLPFIGIRARYDIDRMRNLRLDVPPPRSGKSWRGPHAVFDYGTGSGEFGSNLSEAALAEIRGGIEMAAGRTIRRGEALPAELQESVVPAMKPKLPEAPPAGDAKDVTLGSPSTIALIVANLVPVAGTLLWGWKLSDVMVLYWAESAVIGLFNIAKMVVIGRWVALLAGPFFAGHFGGFMAIHFMFLYMLFVKGPQDNSGGDLVEVAGLFVALWPALAALFVSHAYSFYANFIGRKEYRGRTMQTQMTEPYSRIVFMHLVLILGGGLTLVLGDITPVLVLVIAAKVVVDIRSHLRQRSR